MGEKYQYLYKIYKECSKAIYPKNLLLEEQTSQQTCMPSHHAFSSDQTKVFCVEDIKGIFSDSNNIFLWHESEDINKKSLFPKFQLIPILRFQVMNGYVCFIAS